MTYRQFERCNPGTEVTDSERTGRIVKKSKDGARALVRFEDGMTEWTEYYKIEKTRKP